jgi:Neprosin
MTFGTPERNVDEDDDLGEERPDRALTDDELQAAAKLRLEEIHEYLRNRYSRREMVSRTETRSGVQLDWVPIESQTRDGKVAEPPEEDRRIASLGTDRRQEPVTFELLHEGAEVGPPGTVPLVRRDIEAIRPIGTLQDWLSKDGVLRTIAPDDHPDELVFPEEATSHKYAFSRQEVTCYGTAGNINAWDPFVEWSNEFSLGQLSLSRGSGNGRQTLEVGHQEYRDLYGDWVPHLFVFYTTNNYTESGDNKGGYNQDVDGWVQYSQSIYPEAKSTPLSAFGGTQYVMPLKVQLWQGNWWVRVNGIWIGYYPASLYNAGGLRSEAERVSWYGEVVDAGSHAGTTRTDMGNGHWPYEGWQHCAYMNNLAYQSSTGGGMSRYDPGTIWESHPNCYGIEGHFDNWGSWGPYFWWGGSGKNSQCP